MQGETIAAIATAPGEGGIGIIRLSGLASERILSEVFRATGRQKAWESHRLVYGHAVDETGVIDECMAVLMRAPRSYTREDVAELHCHGGSFVCRRVLMRCTALGARLAEPGEFTRRAFLNGRIDLAQAEAVMSLISARGEQARRAALQQLDGGVSAFVREAAGRLTRLTAGVAACVDYPDEVSEEEATAGLAQELQALISLLREAADERSAHLLSEGLQVVLCGQPNVGKSSLLNALLGEEKAIVTPVPGTTRDRVEGSLTLNGSLIRLIDTAGLRETADPVEAIGVQRSQAAMDAADLLLLILDGTAERTPEEESLLRSGDPRLAAVYNKRDLTGFRMPAALAQGPACIAVSAREPASLAPLKALMAGRAAVSDRLTLSSPRHLAAARTAADALERALQTLELGLPVDLTQVDLQAAAESLGEITGDRVDERLLDAIFSEFCVGK